LNQNCPTISILHQDAKARINSLGFSFPEIVKQPLLKSTLKEGKLLPFAQM